MMYSTNKIREEDEDCTVSDSPLSPKQKSISSTHDIVEYDSII
jgi:hypothetical protein